MNFLNRSIQQMVSLYQSMSVPARIISGLLVVAIVVSLVYLFNYQIHSGESYLYGGRDFSQSELGAMEEALGTAGLNGYEIIGNKIKVPRSRRAEYLLAITENGASPRMAHQFDEPTESFNPFLTKTQQQEQQKLRKQRKIGELIEDIDGIDRAVVEYSETMEPGFPRTIERTAVVSVKAVGTRGLTAQEIDTMRQIASGAFAGLRPSQITVVDENIAKSYRAPDDENSLMPQQNEYAQVKQYWEDHFRRNIEDRLASFSPNVQVLVELDPTLRHVEAVKEIDTTPVATSTSEESKSETTRNPSPGGIPGVTAQNSGANGAATVANQGARESTIDETSSSTDSVAGGRISQTTRAGLVVQSVTVSIGVPKTFYEQLWAQENPPAEGEAPVPMSAADFGNLEKATAEKIQSMVRTIIPRRLQGEDPYQYIVVETDPVIPETPVVEPGMVDNAFSWLASNWQTIGLMLMGVVGLVMLRGMVKSTGNLPPTAETESEDNAKEDDEEDQADVPDRKEDDGTGLKNRFGTSGRNLKIELTELVDEDMEAAANVLKSWIGDIE